MLNFSFMNLIIMKLLSKIYKIANINFFIDVLLFLSVKRRLVNSLTFY